jgi:hypothetical protein
LSQVSGARPSALDRRSPTRVASSNRTHSITSPRLTCNFRPRRVRQLCVRLSSFSGTNSIVVSTMECVSNGDPTSLAECATPTRWGYTARMSWTPQHAIVCVRLVRRAKHSPSHKTSDYPDTPATAEHVTSWHLPISEQSTSLETFRDEQIHRSHNPELQTVPPFRKSIVTTFGCGYCYKNMKSSWTLVLCRM